MSTQIRFATEHINIEEKHINEIPDDLDHLSLSSKPQIIVDTGKYKFRIVLFIPHDIMVVRQVLVDSKDS